ncbi:MAG: hypothetical protein ABWK00_06205, partial [Desulfurococcaceae archaeon]
MARRGSQGCSRRVLIVVEGESDRGFVSALCEELNIHCKVLTPRGNRPNKVVRLINSYAPDGFYKVVVLKDVHRLGERALSELEAAIRGGIKCDCDVRIVRVVKSIESWILAGLCKSSAESVDDPVAELEKELKEKVV